MSSGGPNSTPIDEKFLKHNLKEKRTTAVIWAFSWSEIVNYVLQIAGITAGIVFGVWAIKTYGATETSLAIAANANNVSTDALEAVPPSNFTIPCVTISKSLFMAVMYGNSVGLMPPYSQIDPNTTNQFGDGGSAQGASPSGPSDEPLPPNIELGPQSTPSTSSQPGPQASADLVSTSNSQALGRPNMLPPPKMTSPHQKTTVHFAVAVGIIAAVVALLVIVGAFLVGRKKVNLLCPSANMLNLNGTVVIPA